MSKQTSSKSSPITKLQDILCNKYKLCSVITSSIIAGCTLRAVYCYIHRKSNHHPPGPIGLPFVGSLFSMRDVVQLQSYLLKTYGPISMVYIAQQPFVFLHSIDLIQEVFGNKYAQNRDDWSKASYYSALKPHEVQSMISNHFFKRKRKIFQSVLVSRLEDSNFLNEAHNHSFLHIIESIRECNENKALWHPAKDMEHTMFNAIWHAAFGTSLPFDNDIQHQINIFISQLLKQMQLDMATIQLGFGRIFPSKWLSFYKWKDYGEYIENVIYEKLGYDEKIWDINDTKWKEHFEKVLKDKDSCLISKLIATHRNNPGEDSTKYSLLFEICCPLFTGGMETSYRSAEYGFVLLAKNQKEQTLIYNELYSVFGSDWKMKQNSFRTAVHKLHYLRAFVYETLRLANVAPIGIPHRNDKDIWVQEKDKKYKIAKNTTIIADTYSANLADPYWVKQTNGNPNNLCLEAWLDENGQFSAAINKDKMLAFAYGPRSCPGKTFGLKSLMILFTKFVLNFEFKIENENMEIKTKFTMTNKITPPIGLIVTKR